jgi:uncharacterized protein YndB with AHSA1/START domain
MDLSWQVEVERRIAAPRERVWAVYTDYVGWRRWAGIGPVRIEREGDPPPFGPGCIRVVTGGGREEILSAEAPARLTYRVVSGLPLRDHFGEVTFSDDGDGTLVRWRCRYAPGIPLVGPLFRVVIRVVFRRALRGLAREVEPRR